MKTFSMTDTGDRKQHLGVSDYAWDILMADKEVFFPEKTRNGYLSDLVLNFMESGTYPCNLEKRRARLSDAFSKRLNAKTGLNYRQISTVKSIFQDALGEAYSAEAKEISDANTRPKGNRAFYMTKALAKKLGEMDGSSEAKAFKNPGTFLYEIFEAYATLPFAIREGIQLLKRIQTYQEKIKEKKCIRITHVNGTCHDFIPYRIALDPMGTYHYIAGIDVNSHVAPATRTFVSFRLSRICDDPQEIYTEVAPMSIPEKDTLRQLIREKGIQYLVSEQTTCRIRLTPAGQKKYANQLFLRPAIFRENGGNDTTGDAIYTVHATKSQIQYYFLSFGADAEILDPQDLRDWFAKQYQNAVQIYK